MGMYTLGVIHEVPFFFSRRTFSTVNGTARGMVHGTLVKCKQTLRNLKIRLY